MTVIDRIMVHADRLTATERKVAAILAEEPQIIAFGTVAQVAQRAGTSGPSVVRLAVKLGYDGFVGLQADVQSELAQQLGPARERIREQLPNDLVNQVEATEKDNLTLTLHNLSREALERAASALSDLDHRVWVYPGELTASIGMVLSTFLSHLRPGVTLLSGSDMTIGRALTDLRAGDPMVAIDIHRYERSLVSMVDWSQRRGARLIALTDSPLSPLARQAGETFFMSARGVGPFDSVVGGVALANVLVSAVAAKLRDTAAGRLDTIECAWADWRALVVEPGLSESGSASLEDGKAPG